MLMTAADRGRHRSAFLCTDGLRRADAFLRTVALRVRDARGREAREAKDHGGGRQTALHLSRFSL